MIIFDLVKMTSIVVGKVFKAARRFTVVFLVSIVDKKKIKHINLMKDNRLLSPESIFDTSLVPQRFHIHTS